MNETVAAEAPIAEQKFVRGLGLFDATMLVAGSMIGSGIFIVSADIARRVQSPLWLLAVWGLSCLMTLLGALSYGELAAMLPGAGGQYVYLREAWGKLPAFLFGWTFFLVIQTGTIAAVGVAFGKFLGVFFPAIDEWEIFRTGLPAGSPFASINSAQVVSVLLIALLTAVNLRGIRVGKLVPNVFTTAKIGSLIAVALVGIAASLSRPSTGNLEAGFIGEGHPIADGSLMTFLVVLGAAMVGALFSSDA